MNFKYQLLFLFASSIFCLTNCQSQEKKIVDSQSKSELQKDTLSNELGHGYEFKNNGKLSSDSLKSDFTATSLDSFPLPKIDNELISGLKNQLKLLRYRKSINAKVSNRNISKDDLEKTIKTLMSSQFNNSFGMKSSLVAYQLSGEDQKGNVHYTGYFTPILKVKTKRDNEYQFPIYGFPKKWEGELPTRKQIDIEKVLENRGLEIAYSKSKLDIYFMQVQGSGIVEFENGKRKLLAHAGSNKQSYRSIGKYMIENGYTTPEKVSLKSITSYFQKNPNQIDTILSINDSYIFFEAKDKLPTGAGNVPLTANYSIAVDKKYIPLGSCLLAKIPILDNNRNFSHHEYRILLAQDIGGAIKGTGHVDLYTGIGNAAKRKASNLHHYGQLWLLLPKE